ncbi:MAG TPA: PDGLE domain-containing protein [Solirubrobacter sp.]|nr:PDGLE domain-containing protein [Solirubrobacter sp.]
MKRFTLLALAVAIALGTLASPFASSHPDGLEHVAANHEFAHAGKARSGPLGGYSFPGIGDPRLATALAGFAGTLLVFATGYGVVRIARR